VSAVDHTFLFCDLVGFTALTDAEGDERAAAVAAALQLRVRDLADDHDAELVKGMGDAAMLRCGDPAAAIRMALRLVDEVESDPELPPVRVGSTAVRPSPTTGTGSAAPSMSPRVSARWLQGVRCWSARARWPRPTRCRG
jgi:hypothetical protein